MKKPRPAAPADTTHSATKTADLPHLGGQTATPEEVLPEAVDVYGADYTPAPLAVEVRGVVHTVPAAAQHTVPFQQVAGTKPVKVFNSIPTRRAVTIQNLGTDPGHVCIQNGRPPTDMTDGGLIMANGGQVSVDGKGEWWSLAAVDGQKLSCWATDDDG